MFVLLSANIVSAYTLEDKIQAQGALWEYSPQVPLLEESLPRVSREKLEELERILSSALRSSDGEMRDFITYALISTSIELQSREDREMVQQEVMLLQTKLKNEVSSLLNSAIAWWKDAPHYEEKWNFKMFLNMAIDDFMQFKGELDISNYIAETQVFDHLFSWDIDADYNIDVPGESGWQVDFSLRTNAELIAKDDSVYMKLNNTRSESVSSSEYFELDMAPFIEKLKELSNDNTYLEIPWDYIFSYLGDLTYDGTTTDIKAQIENIFATPLLQVKNKTERGYTLIPSKHFCDIIKKISGIFDPFGGKECSENQYQDMLEDFEESGLEIIMALGNTNTISISLLEDDESMQLALSWNDEGVTTMAWSFLSSSNYSGESHMNFHFVPKESLSLTAGDRSFNTDLSLLIDHNGNIYSGDYFLDIEDTFTMEWVYRNKNILLTVHGQNDETKITCEFKWPMKSDHLDITGWCDMYSPKITEEISINTTLSYDGRNNLNNVDFLIDIELDENNYFDFGLKNTGTRKSVDPREILTPTKTKHIEDFFDELESDLLGHDDDYEYSSNEYDAYSEECYVHESWNSTCYKYYDDKMETCEYLAETDTTDCSDYVYADDYIYEIKEYILDDHTTTCHLYNNGDTTCYEYYEDKSVTCKYLIETDTANCDTYEHDSYYGVDYYDDYYNVD